MTRLLTSTTGTALLFALTFPSAAEAQPAAGTVSLDVYGEGRAVRYAVFPESADPEHDPPIASCLGGCRFWLPPGEYRVMSRAPDGSENAETIELDRPKRMRFKLERTTGRMLGLAGGTLGPLMILGGIALSMCEGCTRETISEQKQSEQTIGGILAVTGIATTAAGWMVFAMSGAGAEIEAVERHAPPRQPAPAWTFAVVPSSHGAFASGQLSF
jgi:hypothetical protein